MGVNQSDRQADVRAFTGTSGSYEGDYHALFDQLGIASGDFNGRLLAYINNSLGVNYTNLPSAQTAFALAEAGASSWNGLGTGGVTAPFGFVFLLGADGSYLKGADGAYLWGVA